VRLGIAVAAMWCEPVTAFSNPLLSVPSSRTASLPAQNHNQLQRPSFAPLSIVSMVASAESLLVQSAKRSQPKQQLRRTTSSSTTKSRKYENPLGVAPPRLSAADQLVLLEQVVELRRIKKIEGDLAMRHPQKSAPLLSIRCREAGYGEDLTAYETAIRNGEGAREELITTNMGLVHYCVKDIVGPAGMSPGAAKRRPLNSLSRDDLIQEGAIGLARAIDRWNPDIGGRFSTYAVYWVRAAILRCIAEKDEIVRVPEHMSAAVRKMTRAAQKLGLDIDWSDDALPNSSWKAAIAAKALAEAAGITDKQLKEAIRIRNRRNTGGYVAFEPWMQRGQDISSDAASVVSGAERDDPLQSVQTEDLKEVLGKYLRPKEMEALFWRYGLLNESSSTERSVPSTAKAPKAPKNYLARAEEELYGSRTSKVAKTRQPDIPVQGKWGEAMSFTEVGKKMEVSAEYGRRLCHAAMKKLRQAAEDGHLEAALLF